MSRDVDNLLTGYLDETLTAEQLTELEAWINADAENAQRFAELVYLDQRLEAEIKLNEISATIASEERVSRSLARPASVVAICIALAACLLTLVAAPYWYSTSEQANSPAPSPVEVAAAPAFLTITGVTDLDGKAAEEFQIGDRLAAEQIQFVAGMMQLEFDSGVEVTLEGPVRYQIDAIDTTQLLTGLMTATVPKGAEGFVVNTPQSKIIDLGTAFGVALNEDGSSLVTVFNGEVEVIDKRDEKRRLVEGESLELDAQGSARNVAFSPKRFERLWPAASGIAKSTGAFRFAPPWPRRLGHVESDAKIFVLPEGYPLTLDYPCPVNIDAPGRYRSDKSLTGGEVPAGKRVRSYVLQFNPADKNTPVDAPDSDKRVRGSITFTKPVLGVIVREEELKESDFRFSIRGGRVPQFKRGLELHKAPQGDGIRLSPDRRTVLLDLSVWGPLSDQVRVIVDASLPGSANTDAP
ncbi:FecR domain-containing protein [Blastopirellula retiformator]|uniref:FecR protein n=1 Tax=Blastopirellula retiformator TaxID=2527970 RepID=A0A5C5UWT7_9BACT|nr:FecR domain-containing protein [Blastopirellula retiformator]TWT30648.1 FecR protein [Blastopirellula retiformator]